MDRGERLRAAVVGCGGAGVYNHIAWYATHPEVELVGLVDADPERAADAAARWGGRRYQDLDTMLDHERPRLVSIATPVHLHAGLATRQLAERKGSTGPCGGDPVSTCLIRMPVSVASGDSAVRQAGRAGARTPLDLAGLACGAIDTRRLRGYPAAAAEPGRAAAGGRRRASRLGVLPQKRWTNTDED